MTPKQERFVEEYLVDLNAAAAYKRAGYCSRSDVVARVEGHRLLANPNVAAAIQERKRVRSVATGITAEQVLRELARVAFSDPRKLYREGGDLAPVKDLDDDTAASLAGVEVFEEFEGRGDQRRLIGHTRKLKRWDKVAALNLLGKHLGLFPERHEHSGPDGGEIPLVLRILAQDHAHPEPFDGAGAPRTNGALPRGPAAGVGEP